MKKITDTVVVLDRGFYTTCTVNFHGATVVSWRIRNIEQLFMSREAVFDDKTIIRGGISFVFPRYGPWNFGPQHGFARIMRWKLEKPPTRLENGDVEAVFSLKDDHFTRSMWNYPFEILYTITLLERELHFDVKVRNLSPKLPFTFNPLLHTYFKVPNVVNCNIIGLQRKEKPKRKDDFIAEKAICEDDDMFEDINTTDDEKSPTPKEDATDNSDDSDDEFPVYIDQWTESLFPDTMDDHELEHAVEDKTIIIRKQNLPDTVLWNPWSEMAKTVPNFSSDEYMKMICFKTGHVVEPVKLLHGEEFHASLSLKIKCPDIDPKYLFW